MKSSKAGYFIGVILGVFLMSIPALLLQDKYDFMKHSIDIKSLDFSDVIFSVFAFCIGFILTFRSAYVECKNDHILILRLGKFTKIDWKNIIKATKIPFCSPPLYRLSFNNGVKPVYFNISSSNAYIHTPWFSWGWDSSGFLEFARSRIKHKPKVEKGKEIVRSKFN